MTATVTHLPPKATDVSAGLRHLADMIDSGKEGAPLSVLILVKRHDRSSMIMCLGENQDDDQTIGQLHTAAHRIAAGEWE